jgi:hypothetical protein
MKTLQRVREHPEIRRASCGKVRYRVEALAAQSPGDVDGIVETRAGQIGDIDVVAFADVLAKIRDLARLCGCRLQRETRHEIDDFLPLICVHRQRRTPSFTLRSLDQMGVVEAIIWKPSQACLPGISVVRRTTDTIARRRYPR